MERGRPRWGGLLVGFLLLSTVAGSGCLAAGTHGAEIAKAQIEAPALAGRVTDAAGLLSLEQIDTLDAYLRDFEARTQHQMVVVTVPSLKGRDISDYTRNLANHWGIGRKDIDDGIVILLALKERRVRVAVGYGLEHLLTDSYCEQVIRTRMAPAFGEGQYFEGLMLGVTDLARAAPRF